MVNSVSPDRAHVQFDPRAKLSLTLSATTYQPCNDRKCETTKLSRSFQSNKRLSNFHWHPPISMALAIKAQLSQQKSLWRTSSFALEHSRRCSIESPRRKKAFFAHASCTARTRARRLLVRGFASNFSCFGNQESLGNAETDQRLGMSVTPATRIRCRLASPSEDSSEKGNQSLDFPHFATFVHTL